jgi:hypothetical protein
MELPCVGTIIFKNGLAAIYFNMFLKKEIKVFLLRIQNFLIIEKINKGSFEETN